MKRILLVGLFLGGCASQPSPSGQLTVALVAPGAGGVTYRLPPGTQLQLTSSSFAGFYSLDAEAASITINVPPGAYGAVLANPGGGYTTSWPLWRTSADGNTTTVVSATTDPNGTVTVVENETVDYAIHFNVATAQVITFAHGTIDVTVDVGENPATSYEIDFDLQALNGTGILDGAAPPELAARLPADVSSTAFSVHTQTAGPWSWASRRSICAPVRVQIQVTGSAGLFDIAFEAIETPDGVFVCINQVNQTLVVLNVFAEKTGLPATTGTFLDLGDRRYDFAFEIDASLQLSLWDITGATPPAVDLGLLVGSQPIVQSATFTVAGSDAGTTTPLNPWYDASAVSDGSLTFSPR